MTDRYEVTRTNGREVEVVRGLERRQALAIVERDLSSGWSSWMEPARATARRTYR